MKGLTIGQLAKRAQVNVETIRYYERRRLVAEPPRRESGYRHYPEDAAARIQFIKRAKELGFSLKEISELLSLRADSDNTCADVKSQAEVKVADVEARMRDLERIREALTRLIAACSGRGPTSECPILQALATSKGEVDTMG